MGIMDKIIYLDAGNSRLKAAVRDEKSWETVLSFPYDQSGIERKLDDICRRYDKIVLASVKKNWQPDVVKKRWNIDITGITRFDIPADRFRYRTIETLGIDRFLACLGAWSLSQSSVIVSDAGTACTLDIMDKEGVYRGGVIMPGLQTMITSIEAVADGLFRVDAELPSGWPPQSTEEALQTGCAGSFLVAWEFHVAEHRKHYPDAALWVTGGDTEFLRKYSKVDFTVHEFLVFEGMHHWFSNSWKTSG